MEPTDKTIRVAYVIGGLPFGGVENWLYDLAGAFRDRPEVDAHIVNVSGTGRKMEEYLAGGFEVRCAGDSKKVLKTFNFSTARNVRAILKDIDPDVVHTLQFSGDYFGRLAARGLGVKVVTHIRNVKSERKWRRRLFNKLLSFATDRYLSVSKAAVATIDREHNWARRPVDVLYNAVNPSKLDVEPHDLSALFGATGKVVLGVGRLVEQKNFDVLIRAVGLLRDRGTDVSAVIVGDGSKRGELAALIAQLGLEDHAFLAGYRPNEEVPRFLRAAHVLAMPSDYEGLPVTHVEAMFCGLPAVISEHVPSIEIAPESSLVCGTDPESVAEKLSQILDDDARHATMSAAARREAADHTMDRYVERLIAFYRDLTA